MHHMLGTLFVVAQVVFIDLVLAGDNAIVVGMAAAGLQGHKRRQAIVIGIGAATVLRIGLAIFASYLLALVGLMLAGGLLLLWVCWKMWREMRESAPQHAAVHADGMAYSGGHPPPPARGKTLGQAVCQIVAADVSMSVDNVLAVSGAAHEHPMLLVFGLSLSVVLMGLAATMLARLLGRHRWIGYLGLLIIIFVAVSMIYRGGFATAEAMGW